MSTIPIWVVDPTGNNNPFLSIVSHLYVAIGNSSNSSWTVSLFDSTGNVLWTVTLNPDPAHSSAGRLFGAVVDSAGNAWALWPTQNANVIIKFAKADGTQTSYTSSDLDSLSMSTGGFTDLNQMAIDRSDNISISGRVGGHGGQGNLTKVLTFNDGSQTSASGLLPVTMVTAPAGVEGTVGIVTTSTGIVVVGLLTIGIYGTSFLTDSANIQAVSGAGWNQIWTAPSTGFGQELQCISSDGLGRAVGQLYTFTGSGITQQGSSFVFAYNDAGGLAWQTSIAGSFYQSVAECIDGDKSGNVYISFAAATNSSLNYGSFSIIKYDSSGSQSLVITDGDASSGISFMAATPTGIIGSADNANYSLWDGTSGAVSWTNTLGSVTQVLGIGRQSW